VVRVWLVRGSGVSGVIAAWTLVSVVGFAPGTASTGACSSTWMVRLNRNATDSSRMPSIMEVNIS
jgi:hypothetical protein